MLSEKPNAQELILFSKARATKDAENKERALMKLRQNHYNALVQVVARIIFQNLSELLLENKRKFTEMFCA